MLARFLYEHLFPVIGAEEDGRITRLRNTDVGVVGFSRQRQPGDAFFPRG